MTKHCAFLLLALTTLSTSGAGEWPHWRGPFFNGSTDETNLPTKWSKTDRIAWSVTLPGSSAATPIVWKNRVFLSGADAERNRLTAACYERTTGKRLWQHDIAEGISRNMRSTFAAPSPVTDGKRVIFFYASGQLVCFDLEGERQWARNIHDDYGVFAFQWTFSSSPTLVDDKLYLQVLQRDVPVGGRGWSDRKNESYILAMDPETGKTLWRIVRPSKAQAESREAFTTPVPGTLDGKRQLLVVGGDALTGHDLQTGQELWRWGTWNPRRIGHWRLVPSPVVGGGVVLACGPKGSPIYAVKPNKAGLLDNDAIAWTSEEVAKEVSSDVPTPAFYDGDFFVLNDLRKHLSRVDPATGKIEWTIRTPGKKKYEASPLAADGKIYLISHGGEAAVFDAATGETLHEVVMDEPTNREVVRASIVATHGHLFIRTTRHLYCIGP